MNNMSTRMDNQQLHLNNRQIQVIVSGRFGDGYLYPEGDRSYYMTNCKYKEYLQYKKDLLGELFIPFFNRFNIYPKLTVERKRDGREFWYLRISKYEGAYEISKILEKYPIECYAYKRWSSETIQKWSKLQEELKSTDIDRRTLAAMLRKVSI